MFKAKLTSFLGVLSCFEIFVRGDRGHVKFYVSIENSLANALFFCCGDHRKKFPHLIVPSHAKLMWELMLLIPPCQNMVFTPYNGLFCPRWGKIWLSVIITLYYVIRIVTWKYHRLSRLQCFFKWQRIYFIF